MALREVKKPKEPKDLGIHYVSEGPQSHRGPPKVKKSSKAAYPIRRRSRSQNQKIRGYIVSCDASEDPCPHHWPSGELVKPKNLINHCHGPPGSQKSQKNQKIWEIIMFLKDPDPAVALRKVKRSSNAEHSIRSRSRSQKNQRISEYIVFL